MKRTELLQELRAMRFEEAYSGWQEGRLRQEEAAQLLGVCERTFRRYIDRYEESGLEVRIDRRLSQVSHRRAQLQLGEEPPAGRWHDQEGARPGQAPQAP